MNGQAIKRVATIGGATVRGRLDLLLWNKFRDPFGGDGRNSAVLLAARKLLFDGDGTGLHELL